MTDFSHRRFLRWLKLGFAFELLLVMLVTLTAIYSLHRLRAEVHQIVEYQNRRVALIHEMRALVRERMMRINMLLLETDPFRRDEYRQHVSELAGRFLEVRARLESMARDADERATLAASRAANRRVAAVVDRILALEEAGSAAEARQLLLSEAIPRQQEVLDRADGLLRLYSIKAEQAIERARRMYQRTLGLLGGLGSAAVLLTVVTGAVVLRRSSRDRQQLLDELVAHAQTETKLRELSASLERQVAERTRELQRTTDMLHQAQHIGRMGHWEWDIASGRLYWSPGIYRLFGLDPQHADATYEGFLERVHPDDRQVVVDAVDAALAGEEPYGVTHRILLPDGQVRHLREQGVVERDESGRPVRMLGTVQDVTETEELQQKLWALAHRDGLTGLPNRLLLLDRLEQALALGNRRGQPFALVLFDLDGFKAVNDTCGHEAGDQLLIEVARRVRGVLRESDTLCRWGGDEFVGLFPGVTSAEDVALLARRIKAQFQEPFLFGCEPSRVGVSIGVACFPADGSTAEALLKCADEAMYRAKRAAD